MHAVNAPRSRGRRFLCCCQARRRQPRSRRCRTPRSSGPRSRPRQNQTVGRCGRRPVSARPTPQAPGRRPRRSQSAGRHAASGTQLLPRPQRAGARPCLTRRSIAAVRARGPCTLRDAPAAQGHQCRRYAAAWQSSPRCRRRAGTWRRRAGTGTPGRMAGASWPALRPPRAASRPRCTRKLWGSGRARVCRLQRAARAGAAREGLPYIVRPSARKRRAPAAPSAASRLAATRVHPPKPHRLRL